ncbi:hypothetical protein BTN49_3083 [Candidatus Enterovibrio escicola]|uniref:Transposase DDE domain-containing protein n=1 Tax=Candidatus Enterovibrio escicola TaxID=1927127 RepID=A0A2A5T058_9GAMM|nr:transposase [Candidatus Enterovibrio escacola]PCS21542.1 hypothetical protein BTN49_3083 [Candidatus Enterovibrio escacola]
MISIKVAMANVEDRNSVSEMVDELWGCLYGNKGYISGSWKRELEDKGVTLIMVVNKNMKLKVMKLWDRLMLRKRFIIETVFD